MYTGRMSFVDLATLALHRRSEMEARINVFFAKCDQAIQDITKMKAHAQTFVHQLNCEPSELKERFLRSMKHLDEYTYLITDFNLSVEKLDITGSMDYTPVHDISTILLPRLAHPTFNIMDTLSEPAPSTSVACSNHCPPENTKKHKLPREEQLLIQFSSGSCSMESLQISNNNNKVEKNEKEVQCELTEKDGAAAVLESCNLPAQHMLQTDHIYPAIIMNIDGSSFWVITDNTEEVTEMMTEMSEYYAQHRATLTAEDVAALTYCAYYDADSDGYFRGLFIRLAEEDPGMAEVFLVDTGEVRAECAVGSLQPLAARFCTKPPYARCCHLAGIDLMSFSDPDVIEKQEELMKSYIGTNCSIQVDDNSSESLDVYVVLSDHQTLNDLLVEKKLAYPIPTDEADEVVAADGEPAGSVGAAAAPEPTPKESDLEITQCPEYEDPTEAVMGYSCRDEADICKHYKGGPNKTCFKGSRCKKKHVLIRPDGWTLDRVEVVAKCRSVPLPAPGTWVRVHVTAVCHFDRVYAQLVDQQQKEPARPDFGVVLPPTTLNALVLDMNSPAACVAYKHLKLMPAPCELVAARYPLDGQWYRARVLSTTRSDQSVEVLYVDYGNVVWVRENEVRELEPRYLALPLQAVRCALAGVAARGHDSPLWADAKRRLTAMTLGHTLEARVIARDYDEITVELFDRSGYLVSEQLAALNLVKLTGYEVDDTKLKRRHVVP